MEANIKGDYLLNTAQYLDFHVSRLQTILKQDPDCLALETRPKLSEPLAILEWLKQKQKYIASLCFLYFTR